VRVRQQGVHEEDAHGKARAELRDLHHPSPVERIREGPSDEGHPHQRHELDEAQEADHGRRVGQLVGLEGNRNDRDFRAEQREGLAGEEQPVVPVPAQRSDVDRRHGDDASESARLGDRRQG
jgi:hypothetical protein